MPKEDKKKYYILECRFYNGEDDNPFSHELDVHEVDKSHLPSPECMKYEYTLPHDEVTRLSNASTSWRYERFWVEQKYNKTDFDFKVVEDDYLNRFHHFEENDGTPIDLKAILWNRFSHWTSGTPEDFKEWYTSWYNTRPTNRQHRSEERRKILIPRCRYYKGEPECPSHLNMYSMFWNYEQMWVEALAYSYKRGEPWRKDFEQAHALMLAKKYDIPATLLGLLYNRYMHFGSGHETQESFAHWIEENYVSQSLSPIDKQQLADECAQECSFEMIIKNVKLSKIIVV